MMLRTHRKVMEDLRPLEEQMAKGQLAQGMSGLTQCARWQEGKRGRRWLWPTSESTMLDSSFTWQLGEAVVPGASHA